MITFKSKGAENQERKSLLKNFEIIYRVEENSRKSPFKGDFRITNDGKNINTNSYVQ